MAVTNWLYPLYHGPDQLVAPYVPPIVPTNWSYPYVPPMALINWSYPMYPHRPDQLVVPPCAPIAPTNWSYPMYPHRSDQLVAPYVLAVVVKVCPLREGPSWQQGGPSVYIALDMYIKVWLVVPFPCTPHRPDQLVVPYVPPWP